VRDARCAGDIVAEVAMKRLIALSVLGAPTMLACASSQKHNDLAPIVPPVTLEVINNGWIDAIIYVYHSGQRYRLGFVNAHARANLHVPAPETYDGDLQFYIHRMAENDLLTDMVHVSDGVHPVLEIEMELGMTSLALFPDNRTVTDDSSQ
jgi:hypothetical protein